MSTIINAPSLANCNLLTIGKEVQELADGGASWFHVDIMDGHYVPNICFPVRLISELKAAYPNILVDVHLMVTDPMFYFPLLKQHQTDYVSFHLDATPFSRRALDQIHSLGMKAGVVINPSQPVMLLEPLLDFVEYVVVMTVEPGYAGQRFMGDSIPRIKELVALREKRGLSFLISVDGGVDYPNARICAQMGVEVFITGNFTVFRQPESITEACRNFQAEMERETAR